MKLFNSLTRQIEEFKTIVPDNVSLYTCGPTVYDYTHIGHIRAYVFNDTVRRIFEYMGYHVQHVMNITDVGHLSDDGDQGVDKMEKGAAKYGKTVWDLAKYYTEFFFTSTDMMNILRPNTICKATEHISEMIAIIKTLIQKGNAYETKEAVYFDISTFKDYGKLSGQNMDDKIKASRDEVYSDPEKKHAADFSLWFKRVGKFKDHTMHWESPWGDGFPGWHIECSAMSMKYLGKTIDVHTGGIDHIPIHHENEIAQSEAASGVPFVHYWMHYHFLQVEGQKMSKSLGNFYTIKDLVKKRISPMAFRLLLLQSHYRQPMNFTWEAAKGAEEALSRLRNLIIQLKNQKTKIKGESQKVKINDFDHRFNDVISNDLQTPQAIAIMWEMVKSDLDAPNKLELLYKFDNVLGLKLSETKTDTVSQEIIDLAEKRKTAKISKNYVLSDSLRKQIENKGFLIEDVKDGYKIKVKG
ncbi:cysteine--tRNA ligase [Candidatus Roizmanbacteria bacterium CG_4_10_14_0_8_um_filter_39_9]|uniref:Cysteine--tRNA ligase n=1 Tax=Candidatus Roizmanbacteria bacterium CG_4_10_14_0_8_um_filter_39_9 TaxID=1974829 RepID=A0A2M7QDX9_9BACT|nr:MAG: cysteine--tRNA ligase [Candidatus Roizmanbacteria bacterium CG_4_10_14_0_8_um_filter_39_9]